jgi:hypothetical protein
MKKISFNQDIFSARWYWRAMVILREDTTLDMIYFDRRKLRENGLL